MAVFQKIESLEDRLFNHPLHSSEDLQSVYELCQKKSQLTAEVKVVKSEIKRTRSVLMLDQLKCRKRVLRRWSLYSLYTFTRRDRDFRTSPLKQVPAAGARQQTSFWKWASLEACFVVGKSSLSYLGLCTLTLDMPIIEKHQNDIITSSPSHYTLTVCTVPSGQQYEHTVVDAYKLPKQ